MAARIDPRAVVLLDPPEVRSGLRALREVLTDEEFDRLTRWRAAGAVLAREDEG